MMGWVLRCSEREVRLVQKKKNTKKTTDCWVQRVTPLQLWGLADCRALGSEIKVVMS